jgi:hypothetical protein
MHVFGNCQQNEARSCTGDPGKILEVCSLKVLALLTTRAMPPSSIRFAHRARERGLGHPVTIPSVIRSMRSSPFFTSLAWMPG